MKVFVIWDPLIERVMSVHSTEALCHTELAKLNDHIDPKYGNSRNSSHCYHFEYDEYEVDPK